MAPTCLQRGRPVKDSLGQAERRPPVALSLHRLLPRHISLVMCRNADRFSYMSAYRHKESRGPAPTMSRAFINEDAGGDQAPRFSLPERDSPHYDEAAAWALIQGADEGDSVSAEWATGCRWGEARLAPEVRRILADAEERGQDRVAQLARRFLRAAGEEP